MNDSLHPKKLQAWMPLPEAYVRRERMNTDLFEPCKKELPKLTEAQIDYMKHAVGFCEGKVRKYRENLYYKPYRNYFYTTVKNTEWQSLVDQGFAEKLIREKGFYYYLTIEGLDILSKLTGITVYSENAWSKYDAKEEVLRRFIDMDVAICYGCWFPTSAKHIAAISRIPLTTVREAIKLLKEEGYLERGHEGGISEDGPYCRHGYFVTDKARELDYWKEAHRREVDYINKSLQEGKEKQ